MTVGIADSIKRPDDIDTVDIGRRVDYTSSVKRDTTGHGTKVFNILSHYVPDATYNFYRYIGSDDSGDRLSGDLLDGIADAVTHGVDILNISGGTPIPEYNPEAPRIFEAEKALRQGLKIVSACGNREPDIQEVTFPAIVQDAISVSGYEPLCRGTHESEFDEFRLGRYATDLDEFPVNLSGQQGAYCGYLQFCDKDGSCNSFPNCELEERMWKRNVDSTDNPSKPDTYAPVMYPNTMLDGVIKLDSGTSFAAPVVSAVLVRVLDALSSTPAAKAVRYGVRQTGVEISSGGGVKLRADRLFTHLS